MEIVAVDQAEKYRQGQALIIATGLLDKLWIGLDSGPRPGWSRAARPIKIIAGQKSMGWEFYLARIIHEPLGASAGPESAS